jgi:hypothetical protein
VPAAGAGGLRLEWTSFSVPRLRYTKARMEWAIYWRDRNLKYHLYDPVEPTPSVESVFAEIDADPTCIFWRTEDPVLELSIVSAALASLDGPRLTIAEAERIVPSARDLYAVHGDHSVWQQLGLGDPPADRPLYVGKAEQSLADRDVRTHFSTAKTGSSTLRSGRPAR